MEHRLTSLSHCGYTTESVTHGHCYLCHLHSQPQKITVPRTLQQISATFSIILLGTTHRHEWLAQSHYVTDVWHSQFIWSLTQSLVDRYSTLPADDYCQCSTLSVYLCVQWNRKTASCFSPPDRIVRFLVLELWDFWRNDTPLGCLSNIVCSIFDLPPIPLNWVLSIINWFTRGTTT